MYRNKRRYSTGMEGPCLHRVRLPGESVRATGTCLSQKCHVRAPLAANLEVRSHSGTELDLTDRISLGELARYPPAGTWHPKMVQEDIRRPHPRCREPRAATRLSPSLPRLLRNAARTTVNHVGDNA